MIPSPWSSRSCREVIASLQSKVITAAFSGQGGAVSGCNDGLRLPDRFFVVRTIHKVD